MQGPTLEEWLADQPRQESIRMLVEADVRRYERELKRGTMRTGVFSLLGVLSPIVDALAMGLGIGLAFLVIFG